MDLEQYLQLLEDVKQRCSLLQHDLQDYIDAVAHRCTKLVHGCAELVITLCHSSDNHIPGQHAPSMRSHFRIPFDQHF